MAVQGKEFGGYTPKQKGASVSAQLEALLKHFTNLEPHRGALIFHETLEAILKIGRNAGRYQRVLRAWIRAEEERSGVVVDLRMGRGTGVYVLTREEQDRSAKRLAAAAKRELWRSLRLVAATDSSKMSDADKVFRDNVLILCALRLAQTRMKPGTDPLAL